MGNRRNLLPLAIVILSATGATSAAWSGSEENTRQPIPPLSETFGTLSLTPTSTFGPLFRTGNDKAVSEISIQQTQTEQQESNTRSQTELHVTQTERGGTEPANESPGTDVSVTPAPTSEVTVRGSCPMVTSGNRTEIHCEGDQSRTEVQIETSGNPTKTDVTSTDDSFSVTVQPGSAPGGKSTDSEVEIRYEKRDQQTTRSRSTIYERVE